jgi:hypothetical protein
LIVDIKENNGETAATLLFSEPPEAEAAFDAIFGSHLQYVHVGAPASQV